MKGMPLYFEHVLFERQSNPILLYFACRNMFVVSAKSYSIVTHTLAWLFFWSITGLAFSVPNK